MKKLRIVFLTVAVILIAAGAAFATNAAKNTGKSIVPGYLIDESTGQCVQKRTDCSTVGTDLCTWSEAGHESQTLYQLMNGTCNNLQLFEPN
jgi:hypothetical protein